MTNANQPATKPKSGPWWIFHPGWLILYGLVSLILVLGMWSVFSSGGWAIPGLIGILFLTMTGRQIWLAAQGNPYKTTK
jgi:hypothetical protein